MTDKYAAAVVAVVNAKDQEYLDFMSRRLVEMAGYIIMSHLILRDGTKASELFEDSAKVFVRYAEAEVEKHCSFISSFRQEDLAGYRK